MAIALFVDDDDDDDNDADDFAFSFRTSYCQIQGQASSSVLQAC